VSLLLAIDTSTDQAGIALVDGEMVSELSWPARQRQTTTILRGIDALLTLAGRSISEVEAVAVATGPGSFSGLRVGMGVAKGLVLALEVALIGVPTLLATAVPHVSPDRRVIAVVAAGRGRLVWAVVEDATPEPAMAGEPVNGSAAELAAFAATLAGPTVVCGEAPGELRESWAGDPRISCPRSAERRPAALGRLGWERWRRGAVDDPIRLEPTYVHLSTPR